MQVNDVIVLPTISAISIVFISLCDIFYKLSVNVSFWKRKNHADLFECWKRKEKRNDNQSHYLQFTLDKGLFDMALEQSVVSY